MEEMDYANIITQIYVTMEAKIETIFPTHHFKRLWKRALHKVRKLGISFETFDKEPLHL